MTSPNATSKNYLAALPEIPSVGTATSDRLQLAYDLAWASNDPSTHVGAVIFDADDKLIGVGWNHILGALAHPERLLRPEKYDWVVHAEVHAIGQAAQNGSLIGATMYCPWACCLGCAKSIVASGVAKLIIHRLAIDRSHGQWRSEIERAHRLVAEQGVQIHLHDGWVGAASLMNGDLIEV